MTFRFRRTPTLRAGSEAATSRTYCTPSGGSPIACKCDRSVTSSRTTVPQRLVMPVRAQVQPIRRVQLSNGKGLIFLMGEAQNRDRGSALAKCVSSSNRPRHHPRPFYCPRHDLYFMAESSLFGRPSSEFLLLGAEGSDDLSASSGTGALSPSATAARCASPRRPRERPRNNAYTVSRLKPRCLAHSVTESPRASNRRRNSSGLRNGGDIPDVCS